MKAFTRRASRKACSYRRAQQSRKVTATARSPPNRSGRDCWRKDRRCRARWPVCLPRGGRTVEGDERRARRSGTRREKRKAACVSFRFIRTSMSALEAEQSYSDDFEDEGEPSPVPRSPDIRARTRTEALRLARTKVAPLSPARAQRSCWTASGAPRGGLQTSQVVVGEPGPYAARENVESWSGATTRGRHSQAKPATPAPAW